MDNVNEMDNPNETGVAFFRENNSLGNSSLNDVRSLNQSPMQNNTAMDNFPDAGSLLGDQQKDQQAEDSEETDEREPDANDEKVIENGLSDPEEEEVSTEKPRAGGQ